MAAFNPWSWLWWTIGLILLLLVVFFVITAVASAFTSPYRCGYKCSMAGYRGKVTSDQERIANRLVLEAYPRLRQSKGFTKKDVDAILGDDPSFNAELYAIFREQVMAGTFGYDQFIKALVE